MIFICFHTHGLPGSAKQQDGWIPPPFFYSWKSRFLSITTILLTLRWLRTALWRRADPNSFAPEQNREREREQEVSPRPIWYACPLLQMNPVWLKPHCVSSPPSFQLPCFFPDLLNHFSANPSFPLVYTHHCGCMLLWKLFRLTFFFYYCKCGWLIVDQACCSLVGRQRACHMQIRCLPYAWLLLAAIENTAQMLQFELRPCINSTNLCRRLICIWLKQLKKF